MGVAESDSDVIEAGGVDKPNCLTCALLSLSLSILYLTLVLGPWVFVIAIIYIISLHLAILASGDPILMV